MPARYQETVHIHRRHNAFLAQQENKSKTVREALDLLIDERSFDPSATAEPPAR